jgi:hypothetical protein
MRVATEINIPHRNGYDPIIRRENKAVANNPKTSPKRIIKVRFMATSGKVIGWDDDRPPGSRDLPHAAGLLKTSPP